MPLREIRGHHETHLRLDRILSESGSSTVFTGFLLSGAEPIPVAVKGGTGVNREIELLRKIGTHQNILQLVDVTREGDEDFAVFELCKGNVTEFAPLADGPKVKTLVEELVQAVSFLHQKKMVFLSAPVGINFANKFFLDSALLVVGTRASPVDQRLAPEACWFLPCHTNAQYERRKSRFGGHGPVSDHSCCGSAERFSP